MHMYLYYLLEFGYLINSLWRITAIDFGGINPAWSKCIMLYITLLSRRAKVIANILISVCKIGIDLYALGSVWVLLGFKISIILALVIELGRHHLSKALLYTFFNCGSIQSTYLLYTSRGRSSSPCDLQFENKLFTAWTSSREIRESNRLRWEVDNWKG